MASASTSAVDPARSGMASSSSLGADSAKETCDLTGLAATWDGLPEIRQRLRNGEALFSEVSERNFDIRTPSAYVAVMKPILTIMRETGKKLPSIDAVRDEVRAVDTLNKRELVAHDVDKVSWNLKKYAGFVKMKCRKGQPSTDT